MPAFFAAAASCLPTSAACSLLSPLNDFFSATHDADASVLPVRSSTSCASMPRFERNTTRRGFCDVPLTSPRSVGRVTTTVPSSCAIAMRSGICCCRVPSGPATATRPGSTETVTPEGISMGFFPIRLIRSPDEADDLATDPALLRGPARDEPGGRGQDRDAHSSQHARETILPRVDPAARLGDALQARDDPFAIPAELEIDDQGIEGFALLDVLVPDG